MLTIKEMNMTDYLSFGEAIQWVEKGGRVKLEYWKDTEYLEMGNSFIGKFTNYTGFQYWTPTQDEMICSTWIKIHSDDVMELERLRMNIMDTIDNIIEYHNRNKR